jgi:hypothetical protein
VPALSEEGEGESPEGVDVLTGNGDGDGVGDGLLDVSPLVAALARSEGSETVDLPTGKGDAKLERTQVLEAVTDALQSAVEEARLDTRRGTRLERPRQLLVEAESKLRRAVDTYEEVKDEPDFDLEAFRDEFERVERRVEAFRQKT